MVKEAKSTVSDDFQVSLRCNNTPLKLPFERLKACVRRQTATWIWAPSLIIIIRFLPNIIDHIVSWRWEDVIQRKLAAATMHTYLGTRFAVGLLATINATKSVRLFNSIAAFKQPSAVLLSNIGVTLWAWGPPSLSGSSWLPESSQMVWLGSGSLPIAAFTIDTLVISTIDVTIGSMDWSSPGLCHENIWVLFSTTIYPVMLGSTEAMVKLKGWTRKSAEALERSVIGKDWWPEVTSSLSSVS